MKKKFLAAATVAALALASLVAAAPANAAGNTLVVNAGPPSDQ